MCTGYGAFENVNGVSLYTYHRDLPEIWLKLCWWCKEYFWAESWANCNAYHRLTPRKNGQKKSLDHEALSSALPWQSPGRWPTRADSDRSYHLTDRLRAPYQLIPPDNVRTAVLRRLLSYLPIRVGLLSRHLSSGLQVSIYRPLIRLGRSVRCDVEFPAQIQASSMVLRFILFPARNGQ